MKDFTINRQSAYTFSTNDASELTNHLVRLGATPVEKRINEFSRLQFIDGSIATTHIGGLVKAHNGQANRVLIDLCVAALPQDEVEVLRETYSYIREYLSAYRAQLAVVEV